MRSLPLLAAGFVLHLTASAELLSPCPTTFDMAGEMPPGSSRSCACLNVLTGGGVFGSGRYAPASWICAAARHAGQARVAGDKVTFYRQAECPRLWGSEANGVVSVNWGAPTVTFSFTAEPPACPPAPATGPEVKPCPATLKGLADGPEGKGFDCTCTWKKYERGSVWGNHIYAIHSDVCNAAQHAGAVKSPGSTVTVFLGGGCSSFTGHSGSTNFIRASRWGESKRSFAFRLPYPPCADGSVPSRTTP